MKIKGTKVMKNRAGCCERIFKEKGQFLRT